MILNEIDTLENFDKTMIISKELSNLKVLLVKPVTSEVVKNQIFFIAGSYDLCRFQF